MTDILVVGSGGREHAIIKKLKASKGVGQIYAAPGNAGIGVEATCVDIAATDIEAMVRFAKDSGVGFVVVTPDDPLALGMVDAMEREGIPAFGPTAAAARIESSKIFAKELMLKNNIPTAAYKSFDDKDAAVKYIESCGTFPLVIKADGLALGKGVIIAENRNEALDAVESMMSGEAFGKSGLRVVIEEFLKGIEVTVLTFTDGETVVPMASSMDHKRAHDGDIGPNTGGMGTIAPHPMYKKDIADRCMQEIFLPTVRALKAQGTPFKGCLYFGLMLTENGPKVIEYNCRFGDPEAQVVLPLLDADLFAVMRATRDGSLSKVPVRILDKAAACVIIASGGYPGSYKKGLLISGLDESGGAADGGATICHAGTKLENGRFLTNGGRVLGVVTTGDTLKQALDRAYREVPNITFEGAFYRHDIGKKALMGI